MYKYSKTLTYKMYGTIITTEYIVHFTLCIVCDLGLNFWTYYFVGLIFRVLYI